MGASCSSNPGALSTSINEGHGNISSRTSQSGITNVSSTDLPVDQRGQERSMGGVPRTQTNHVSSEINNLLQSIHSIDGFFDLMENSRGSRDSADSTLRTGAPPPASSEAVLQLPRVCVNSTCDSHRDCGICYEQHELGSVAMKMPCGHIYHRECLEPWLRRHCTCPVCRYEMTTDSAWFEPGRLERMGLREDLDNNFAGQAIGSTTKSTEETEKRRTSNDLLLLGALSKESNRATFSEIAKERCLPSEDALDTSADGTVIITDEIEFSQESLH